MKITEFDLLDSSAERDELLEQVRRLNDCRSDYPRDKTVHHVFQEVAARHPQALAIAHDGKSWTYEDLDTASNRLAHFLLHRRYANGSVISVILDHTFDICVTLLGILKAGHAYLPIDHDVPYQRARYLLDDTRAQALISSRRHLNLLNGLQWDCHHLRDILCVDAADYHAEIEPEGEKMKQGIWDYVGEEMFDDISGGGWKSSYTGDWLSREVMDEYGENAHQKLSPLLTSESKIIEIGCSSGISMFRLAPQVAYYLGTDLSPKILEKSECERVRRGLDNLSLQAMPAHEIDTLREADFDVVIINSVIQCFSGHNYLRSVLTKALGQMKSKGWIFLGNLFDRELKDRFLESLNEYRRCHHGDGSRTKTDYSDELFIDRAFLDDLRFDFPEIAQIEYSYLVGHQASELREFTFDAILRIDKTACPGTSGERSKHQFDRSAIDAAASTAVDVSGKSEDLAYVMYTSGTTGEPKGVMIPHRAINRLVINTNYVQISSDDRILQTGALGFDASTFEIWGALLNGASICRPPENSLLDVGKMKQLTHSTGTSILWLTSSLFNQYVDSDVTVFEGLRHILVGGERLSPTHVNQVRLRFPQLTLTNGYGPTENTTFTSYHHIDTTYNGEIPIGVPVANSEVWILDEEQALVPLGVVGEICAGGDGLALGYLNDPELTEQKFINHPFSPGERLYRTGDLGRWLPGGTIEYRGRIDSQLKVRGHRIESGEVETQMALCEGVKQAVVIGRDLGDGMQTLLGYMTGTRALDMEDMREEMRQVLPEYMVPSYLIELEELPLTPNGKVDRKRLPSPTTQRSQQSGSKRPLVGPVEQELGGIWEEVLGVSTIGPTDSFFDAGGHSLRLSKMVTATQEHFGVEIPLSAAFRAPTIRQLAILLEENAKFGIREVDSVLVPLTAPDKGPVVFAFPPGTGDVLSYVQLAASLETFQFMAFQFIVADTRIGDYADHIHATEPNGPYLLVGYSYGGNLAFHVARELERRGKQVETIIMIDSSRRLTRITYPEGEPERVARQFMEHESLRSYFSSELLRQRVFRQIHAYYEHSQETVDEGMVQADQHVILAEDAVTEYRNEAGSLEATTSGWRELTSSSFTTHDGSGHHNQMLYGPALERNIRIIRSILTGAATE
jgi:amino acid adenylation domain-containing protein